MPSTITPITRRSFLNRTLGASCLLGSASIHRLGFAADSAAAEGRDLLVTIFLRGGCDGLGLLAPVDDGSYRAARAPSLRVAEKGEHAGIPVARAYAGRDWRLHPAAAPLQELYAHGDLALIHACGLINGSRSHFDAQDMMERGINDQKNLGLATGWLTRLIDSLSETGLLPGLAAAGTLPTALLGSGRAAAIDSLQDFNYYGGERELQTLRLLQGKEGALSESALQTLNLMAEISKRLPKKPNGDVADYAPTQGVKYPESDFSQPLKTVAQLAKMEVGLQVAAIDYGDWDTHTDQDYRLKDLIENLAKPLRAFYEDLAHLKQRVTIVAMSEFGRRLKANESGGTDHGHGNVMLVLGAGINGGRCLGSWPGLENDQLDQHADLAITTDYRQVLAELLQARMRGADLGKIFPGFKPGNSIDLV